MKTKTEAIFTPEQFAQMKSEEIAAYIRANENTAIVGEKVGVDRHVIRYKTNQDWFVYTNPFIK